MVISVGAAFKAELERDTGARPVILINLDFVSENRRFAMWPYDVEFSGETFLGLGPIAEVEEPLMSQDTPLTEQFLRFFVQNQPDLLADIQQGSRGRMCTGRLLFLDDDNETVGDSIVLWHKRMVPGKLTGSEGAYSTDIALESRFHRHRNRAPRTYSHAQQLERDATDFAFIDAGKSQDFSRPRYVQKSGLQ